MTMTLQVTVLEVTLLCLNLVLKVLFRLELGITQVPTISKRSVLALTSHSRY